MDPNIVTGILSLTGTLLGTAGGIFAETKLLEYRINQLERRMDAVHDLVERIYQLEKQTALHEERIKAAALRYSPISSTTPT